MARRSKADSMATEWEAIRLRVHDNKTFAEIAQALGYSGTPESAAGTAHQTVMRGLRRVISEDAAELRLEDLARLEALLTAIWPIAMHDIKLTLSYHWEKDESGKHQVPDYCYEKPTETDNSHVHGSDGSGAHICYVMPSESMIKAQEKALKILERRSRYMGLDHADGVADRIADIMKQNAQTLGEYMRAFIENPELGFSEKQKESAKILLMKDIQRDKSA